VSAPVLRVCLLLLLPVALVEAAWAGEPRPQRAPVVARPEPLPRVVSLNPSITSTLLALDAREALVGVDDYSAVVEPSVGELPRVGGLFNPSLEAIVGLAPDFVALVPSAQQRSLVARLTALEIPVLELANITLPQLLDSIATLGARVGRGAEADRRVAAIERAFADAERAAASRERIPAVLVLQRDPVYVVGAGSFLDRMLGAVGVENLGAVFDDPYPRVGVEWLIARAPQLLLDASEDPEEARAHWARWPSIPAVASGRVVTLAASEVTLPGPYIDRALHSLARAVDAARDPASAQVGVGP
jgi:iron complex transport system substrate-binding protein